MSNTEIRYGEGYSLQDTVPIEIVEICPHCMEETVIAIEGWDGKFTQRCWNCKRKLMLCSECFFQREMIDNPNSRRECDWTEENGCWREREERKEK